MLAAGATLRLVIPEIGIPGLILILVVALLVFGPKRLPEMGRSLGRGMREFKDSITGKDTDEPAALDPPDEDRSAGFCSSCGTPLAPGAQFCANCGTPVTAAASSPGETQRETVTVERDR
jgi:sec-independent protein translocase protein TatA